MPSNHEKDGGEPATAVPLSRRELLAVSVSGLVASPETSTLLESTPAAIPASAAAAIFPDRWWERQGRHNPPPGTKMLTWATVDPDNRLELDRFYFEIYCEEMCDATGDPEQDKPIDELMAAWQRIRADNEAFFAQRQVSRCEPETGRQGR